MKQSSLYVLREKKNHTQKLFIMEYHAPCIMFVHGYKQNFLR